MFVVGVTGGIGSGKTAVTDRFAQHGITIVDADIAARVVVEPGQPALKAIEAHFGKQVINKDGSLDRRALREIVFAHPKERQWLESLTHPLIGQEIQHQIKNSNSPYTILVSPLLLEGNQHQLAQRILVIDVPEELQIERTISRDNTHQESVKAIMAAQMQRVDRLAKADDIVINDKGLDHLHHEVDNLHSMYLNLATQEKSQPL